MSMHMHIDTAENSTPTSREAAVEAVLIAEAGPPWVTHVSPTTLRERRCWRTFLSIVVAASAALGLLVMYAWSRTIASARDPVTNKVAEYSFPYFVLCFIAGAVAGLAHVFVTPIDVVKCRVQVGQYASMTEGFQRIFADAKGSLPRALRALFRGWVPTLYGYVIQGSIKFGLYEIFKDVLASAWLADASGAAEGGSGTKRLAVFLLASCVAEVFADLGLAPFEAVKIKVQTTTIYPEELGSLMPSIWATEGLGGFYKGLVPLWGRQVPYTMMKFASFEAMVRVLSRLLLPAENASAAAQLAVTMLAGVLAGFLCALVSHPADTLVSKMNQRGRRGSTVGGVPPHGAMLDGDGLATAAAEAAVVDVSAPLRESVERSGVAAESARSTSVAALILELGWAGLWRGLVARMAMVGALTAMQWLMYDAFKVAVGLPTTGGGGAARK